MALNQSPDVDISKLKEVCVWPELSSSCCFLQKQGTGFPRATVETELTQCEGESHEHLDCKLHPRVPQKPWGTCTEKPMSLKNCQARPKHSTSSPVPFPVDVGTNCWWFCTAFNGSLTPSTMGTALSLVIAAWCWWGRDTGLGLQPWNAPVHLEDMGKSQTVCVRGPCWGIGIFHQFGKWSASPCFRVDA